MPDLPPAADDAPLPPDLAAAVEACRAPVPASPDFAARVMAEVRRTPAPGRRWWAARSIRIAPIPAGLLAAAIGTLVFLAGRASRPADVPRVQEVRFVLAAPDARRVALVGDFNQWQADATPLQPSGADGVWIVTVPLRPGTHQYAFVVDGTEWRADPAAPIVPDVDFGRPNSLVTVPEVIS